MITEKNRVQLRIKAQSSLIEQIFSYLFACNLIDNDDNNDDICRKENK